MEERKIKERDFHNKIRVVTDDSGVAETRWSEELESTIKNNPLWVNMKYYSIERESRDFVLDFFRKNTKDKVVLDYCAGNGEDGVLIASGYASKVYGIDISDVSISNCRTLAEKKGVSAKTEYKVGDAENTGYDNDTFDVITEYGALHHLDQDSAFRELARILKKDGKVICNEALAHNLLIHAYRKLTPHLRTDWEVEHIMKKKDILKALNYFNDVEIHLFHLSTLLSVPFRNTFIFRPMLSMLEKLDKLLLKIPVLKWQAWQAVFILSNPKKETSV